MLPASRTEEHQPIARSLRRWSATAYGCVAVLVVSGEYQASRQLTPVQSLWSTSYGQLLLYPWSYQRAPAKDRDRFRGIGDRMSSAMRGFASDFSAMLPGVLRQ